MDGKYFNTKKKGELYELKLDLHSDKKDGKKEAIKRIIACMTTGKDVSELFPDVVNCMQTEDMELKKLVYLYLMNYAKSHPDMAILGVNTFVKDCDDSNPLIRALAVRTMGCIRVSNISEYLCEPLRKCLKDEDPYVRKTAAVCVVKLHSINPELVEEQGFLASLRDLLGDANPMVISNSVAALSEIVSHSPSAAKYFELNPPTVNKLLTALNECTEWGQIFIIDSLANYVPSGLTEAQSICERVTSRLSHANAALVLSTVKLLLLYIDHLGQNTPFISSIYKKMGPPLITLLSCDPEIQYVALRNINLITQKCPEILKNDAKSFFVKYNDPIYVKLEKLGIMIRLVNDKNIQQILNELKEYASEVDVDFVRRSVCAIGRCALKVESAADKCVNTLLDLIQTKVSYVVQESIVVMRDILRKFPNKYESVIEKLCENLDTLEEPEARGALIWIIGEYAERIDNASDILASFVDGFFDENALVQLQILTAIVKLFVKKPSENQELVQHILTMVTHDSDNPDIRDRGYVYWRLLSTDSIAARNVILAEKPLISPEADNLEPSLLNELLENISTLSSVYHKPPQSFIQGAAHWKKRILTTADKQQLLLNEDILPVLADEDNSRAQIDSSQIQNTVNPMDDLIDLNFTSTSTNMNTVSYSNVISKPANQRSVDLLSDSFVGLATNPHSTATSSNLMTDLFDLAVNTLYIPPAKTWLPASKGKGLDVIGNFGLSDKGTEVYLKLSNNALAPMSGFSIQFNGNYFRLSISEPVIFPATLPPRQSVSISIPVNFNGLFLDSIPIDTIQIALRNNVDIFYFSCTFPIHFYFKQSPASISDLNENSFTQKWNELQQQQQQQPQIDGVGPMVLHETVFKNLTLSLDEIGNKLKNNKMSTFCSSKRPATLCGKCILMNDSYVLLQISQTTNVAEWRINILSNPPKLTPAIQAMVESILKE